MVYSFICDQCDADYVGYTHGVLPFYRIFMNVNSFERLFYRLLVYAIQYLDYNVDIFNKTIYVTRNQSVLYYFKCDQCEADYVGYTHK